MQAISLAYLELNNKQVVYSDPYCLQDLLKINGSLGIFVYIFQLKKSCSSTQNDALYYGCLVFRFLLG